MARPTKLTPEVFRKAQEYLELCKDKNINEAVDESQEPQAHGGTLRRQRKATMIVRLPTKGGLARYLSVSRECLYEWARNDEKFSDIMEELSSEQEDRLINMGLSGEYNSTIAKVLLTKHGYSDKLEQEVTHHGDVTFINAVPRPKE